MLTIPLETQQFPLANRWGVVNSRSGEIAFSVRQLLHAAITAGHGMGWRRGVRSEVGGLSELLWKQHAFQAAVCPSTVIEASGRATERLMRTPRLKRMDSSERRGLMYHLGNTMATAWGRAALGIPWWLHLDEYLNGVDPPMDLGTSRPDFLGRHADGHWVVMESKGLSSRPNTKAERKAKTQSTRIIAIGNEAPALCVASFSFFPDKANLDAIEEADVLHMRVIDPEGSDEDHESIYLREMTDELFFRLYYRTWVSVFSSREKLDSENGILWRNLPDLDMRVGILERLKRLLDTENYASLPAELAQPNVWRLSAEGGDPDWVGDGVFLVPGDSWTLDWK